MSVFGRDREPNNGIIARLVATPKAQGGYDLVHPVITDANFPATVEPSLKGAQLEAYGKRVTSGLVLADLKAKGRRAGNAAETLDFGQKNPEEQRKHWIVGLGQAASIPSRGACVVVLYESGDGKRLAGLDEVAVVWRAERVFLSLPL